MKVTNGVILQIKSFSVCVCFSWQFALSSALVSIIEVTLDRPVFTGKPSQYLTRPTQPGRPFVGRHNGKRWGVNGHITRCTSPISWSCSIRWCLLLMQFDFSKLYKNSHYLRKRCLIFTKLDTW